jgi:thiazole synthase
MAPPEVGSETATIMRKGHPRAIPAGFAAPIGSRLGLLNPFAIPTIKHRLSAPVIVAAGVGTASDACLTMEQSVDGTLMSLGFAAAFDLPRVAAARCLAVAVPSSPFTGMLS